MIRQKSKQNSWNLKSPKKMLNKKKGKLKEIKIKII